MTARKLLRVMLAERRMFPKHSADWAYRTRAARTYIRLIRGIPTTQWRD